MILDHLQRPIDDIYNIGRRHFGVLRPGVFHEILNDFFTALGLLVDDLQRVEVGVARPLAAQEVFDKADDDAERVVEFVGHGGGHLAQRDQSSRRDQLLFQLLRVIA